LRFANNGPSIPDELLVARDEGRVVFFCGAGVSRAKAGLKDFIGLAHSVTDKLSIAADKPARQLIKAIETFPPIAGIGSLISADRVFGLIERDFRSEDIYRAIAETLKPEGAPDLTAHRLLLDLARGPDGTIRLITTNFDLLFEDCDSTIPISSPPRLPDPLRSDEFGGIIHLHGHVTPNYSDAAGEGLIISSAEFGRAYLSERWAADFIRTVLERYFVVFVGYSADDPPMQYLLEALNRAPGSFSGAYALQSGSYEDAEARWVQKGVKPIVYDDAEKHSALWDTLALWAERARDPAGWHDTLLSKASVGPGECEPHIRGQIAHVVSTLDGAKRVAQAVSPIPADWLCTFDPYIRFAEPGRTGTLVEPGPHFDPFQAYGLDSDPVPANVDSDSTLFQKREVPANAWSAFALMRQDRQNLREDQVPTLRGHWAINQPSLAARVAHLGQWLQRIAHQPAAVWWAASQGGIHPDIQRQIEFGIIGKTASSSAVREAWRYLIGSWKNRHHEFSRDYFQLLDSVKVDGWNAAAVREFANLHKPHFKVGRAFYGSPRAPDSPEAHFRDLVHLEVEYPHHNEESSIPQEFLSLLVRELRLNLQLGSALEEEMGGYGLHMLVSVEPDEGEDSSERAYKSGINVPLFEYIKFFRRLMQSDGQVAKEEALAWRNSKGALAAHIKIWLCSETGVVDRREIAAIFRTISREEFLDGSHQRDLLLLLESRWSELNSRTRRSMERRLLRGSKRWKGESLNDFKQRKVSAILSRINYLASKGCEFSFDVDTVTKELHKDYPEWQPKWASKAALSMGMRSGWVKTDTRSDELLDQPLADVLNTAAKLSGKSPDEFFVERDPYAGLCALKPVRAFAALTAAGKAGKYPQGPWQTFLNHESRKVDSVRFIILIASRLSCIPAQSLNELLRPVTDWLLRVHQTLLPKHREVLNRLWVRIVVLLKIHPKSEESSIGRGSQLPDWATEALNSPVGYLAQILMSDPALHNVKTGDQFPDWWKERSDELLSLSGGRRRHAMAIFCHNLVWLFSVDQQWTTRTILPVLERQDSDTDALWAGFFWGAKVPQEPLFILMKPALLRLAHKGSDTRRKHAEILAGIILAGWGRKLQNGASRIVTDSEMTALLIDADDDFRTQLIWHLEIWTKDDPKSHWIDDAIILLTQVWPKQLAAKTPRVSAKLAELAFAEGDRFPQFVDSVLPLVVPIDQDYINLPTLRREKGNLVEKYPERTLALLHAVLTDNARQWPYGISEVLDSIGKADPRLLTDGRLIKLNRIRASF
jgi:SIR2-like protein